MRQSKARTETTFTFGRSRRKMRTRCKRNRNRSIKRNVQQFVKMASSEMTDANNPIGAFDVFNASSKFGGHLVRARNAVEIVHCGDFNARFPRREDARCSVKDIRLDGRRIFSEEPQTDFGRANNAS